MRMATLHLFEDRDRSETWRRLQHRDHFRVEEVREGIRPAASSHLIYGGRRPMILFEAIGRGETDRCLRGRDRRAVCLSERHVEPHLVIGDMAAGQWVDPSMRRSIHGAGRSRSHDDRGPRESFVASRCGAGTSGRASPSLRHQPRNDFLILIVGDSTLIVAQQPAQRRPVPEPASTSGHASGGTWPSRSRCQSQPRPRHASASRVIAARRVGAIFSGWRFTYLYPYRRPALGASHPRTGKRLPRHFAPWRPVNGGRSVPAISMTGPVIRAVRRDGYFLVSASPRAGGTVLEQ